MFQRFFLQWSTLIGPSPKTFWKPPSSPKIYLHNFTHLLFYIYTYMSVNGPCTLTWSVSLEPYTWYEHHKHIDNIFYYLYIIWIQTQLKSNSTHEKQDANWCIMKSHMLNCLFIFMCANWWNHQVDHITNLFHQFSLLVELYIPYMLKTP